MKKLFQINLKTFFVNFCQNNEKYLDQEICIKICIKIIVNLIYIFAKKNQGKFLVRIEDTDKKRTKKEFIKNK